MPTCSYFSLFAGNRPPYETTAVKPQVIVRGQGFFISFSTKFYDPDGDDLAFAQDGLPAGSGLSIHPRTGDFSGVPTEVDVNANQPIVVRVIATDGKAGRAQQNMLLYIEGGMITELFAALFIPFPKGLF